MLTTTDVRDTSDTTSVTSSVDDRDGDTFIEARCHDCDWKLLGCGPRSVDVVVPRAEAHVCPLRLAS